MAERFIEYVALEDLVGADVNPKRHATEDLAVSLREFGYTEPVLMDERTGKLVAGHGRLEMCAAARAEGLAAPDGVRVDGDRWLIPVTRGWASRDDNHASRYLVASNRLTEKGGWDDRALYDLLDSLADTDGLVGTGYDSSDLDAMLASLTEAEPEAAPVERTEPDDAPDIDTTAVLSSSGDMWLLGQHRLVCGDSTDAAVVEGLMRGERANMVWTDPPYGVDYVGKTADALTIQNDALSLEALEAFLRASLGAALAVCMPGAAWWVAAPAGPQLLAFANALSAMDVWRQSIVWVKDQFVLGHSDYHYRHEVIFYGWAPGGAHHATPDRGQDSVWEIARPKRSAVHPTMKPVALVQRAIENSSAPGDVVLDVFGGSGTTLVAAHRTGRTAMLVEKDPKYADVICRRWQNHTGILPIRERDGEPVDFALPE